MAWSNRGSKERETLTPTIYPFNLPMPVLSDWRLTLEVYGGG